MCQGVMPEKSTDIEYSRDFNVGGIGKSLAWRMGQPLNDIYQMLT